MIKKLTRKYLDSYGWNKIQVGSHIVSYCDRCEFQRVFNCIDMVWDEDDSDWTYSFECSFCKLLQGE